MMYVSSMNPSDWRVFATINDAKAAANELPSGLSGDVFAVRGRNNRVIGYCVDVLDERGHWIGCMPDERIAK